MPYAIYNTSTGAIRCISSIPISDCGSGYDETEIDGYSYTHIIDGVPTYIPVVETDQQKLYDIRSIRNSLLSDADVVHCNSERWSQMSEIKKQEWVAYKQELRDFPASCDPNNPVWPTLPTT